MNRLIERVRPNMMAGLVCLMVISLAATTALPPAEAKEVLLVVAGALATSLQNLLSDRRSAK